MHKVLNSGHFIKYLERFDGKIAQAAKAEMCRYCGGKLHCGDYARKPRGVVGWDKRHSFNCARCRRRKTPPSVRFLGRRVYAGVVVALVSALMHGLNAGRAQVLVEKLGIDRRTLKRWLAWWRAVFVTSGFWKGARASFMPQVEATRMPLSLLEAFGAERRAGCSSCYFLLRRLPLVRVKWRWLCDGCFSPAEHAAGALREGVIPWAALQRNGRRSGMDFAWRRARREGCAMPKQDADYSAGGGGSGGCARWAHFRFSVIGPLLAAPPGRGDLQAEIALLAGKQWRHPVTGQWVRFGSSTIERWYYRALHGAKDPVGVLTRKVRNDHGAHRSLSFELRNAISVQHQQHPEWSCQLHYDNLAVRVAEDSRLGALPSYVSVRRYMRAAGMFKRRRLGGRRDTAGARAAEARFAALEVRSYESEYVNALWHLDFHQGSIPVLTKPGEWLRPQLLGVLDDHSRMCCHLQWYWRKPPRT